jgi:hypothetical protein
MAATRLFHRNMEYVDVPNVPLVKVGTWHGSTGAKSITPQDLEDMVVAAKSGDLDDAVIKKGHNDPRMMNPMWDGEPAYGQVKNLRITDGGTTLMGDLKHVPKDLAESMPSAYPRRSVEIAWNVRLKDALGKIQKTYRAALSGLALLGATPPAVKGLGGPRAATATAFSAEIESMDTYSMGGVTPPLTGARLYAAINGAILERMGADEDSGIMVTQLSEGSVNFKTPKGTYAVEYELNEDNSIRLAETVEALEGTSTGNVPHMGGAGPDAENDRPKSSEEKEPTVAFMKELREKLGLPETATDEEVLTKVGSSNFSADENSVIVSKTAFAELQERANTNAEEIKNLREASDKERRDNLVETFFSEGKIHPTEREYWRKRLDADEADVVTFMSARTPIFPVQELGSMTAYSTAVTADLDDDAVAAIAAAVGVTGIKGA